MIIISTHANLSHVIEREADASLRGLLQFYLPIMTEYEMAILFVVQPGDRLRDLNCFRNRPFEGWEFIKRHSGGWYEAVFILSDDGFGHVVLAPQSQGIDAELIDICRTGSVSPD